MCAAAVALGYMRQDAAWCVHGNLHAYVRVAWVSRITKHLELGTKESGCRQKRTPEVKARFSSEGFGSQQFAVSQIR